MATPSKEIGFKILLRKASKNDQYIIIIQDINKIEYDPYRLDHIQMRPKNPVSRGVVCIINRRDVKIENYQLTALIFRSIQQYIVLLD